MYDQTEQSVIFFIITLNNLKVSELANAPSRKIMIFVKKEVEESFIGNLTTIMASIALYNITDLQISSMSNKSATVKIQPAFISLSLTFLSVVYLFIFPRCSAIYIKFLYKWYHKQNADLIEHFCCLKECFFKNKCKLCS